MFDIPATIEKASKSMLSWLSQREVKTPLSFFFKIAGYLALITLTLLWLGSNSLQQVAFFVLIGFLGLVFLAVVVFAWFRPKNLVYGESGHRAERKFSLGTESREIPAEELAKIRGVERPKEIGPGEVV